MRSIARRGGRLLPAPPAQWRERALPAGDGNYPRHRNLSDLLSRHQPRYRERYSQLLYTLIDRRVHLAGGYPRGKAMAALLSSRPGTWLATFINEGDHEG